MFSEQYLGMLARSFSIEFKYGMQVLIPAYGTNYILIVKEKGIPTFLLLL